MKQPTKQRARKGRKIMLRIYDAPKDLTGLPKANRVLGHFRVVERIYKGSYEEQFIGQRSEDGKLYLVTGHEVSFENGGTMYSIKELKNVTPAPPKKKGKAK